MERILLIVAALFAATFSVLVGICVYLTPLSTDDLYFVSGNYDYVRSLSPDLNWGAMWQTMVQDFLGHNGRFGDRISVVALTLLSHGWFATVCGVMTALALFMMFKLALPSRCKWLLLGGACLLTMAFFPWCDHMAVGCFNINYLWSSALALLCVYIFVSASWIESQSVVIKVLVALLFVLSAPLHEQTSAAVGAAMTAIVAFNYMTNNCAEQVRRWRGALLCFWFAGSLIWVLSPASFSRAGETGIVRILMNAPEHLASLLTLCAVPSVAFLLFGTVVAIVFTARRGMGGWKRVGETRAATTIAICFLVTLINVWFYLAFTELRILALGTAFSSVGLLILADRCLPESRCLNAILIAIIFGGPSWFTRVYLDQTRLQEKLGKEYTAIMDKYAESDNGLVVTHFTDGPGLRNHPWEIAYTDQWTYRYNLGLSRLYYFRQPMPHHLRLLPYGGINEKREDVLRKEELATFPTDTLTGCKRIVIKRRTVRNTMCRYHATAVPFLSSELTGPETQPEDGDTLYYVIAHYDSRHRVNEFGQLHLIK